ncbi:MAG: MBL fold metallo-hydrolase [Gemmatimonadales bacterium]
MHFHQFYIGCLAHASYLIGDGGEAVVVDPSRDVQMYLDEAEAHGLTITWILETHLHADFVSGHLELAARTGATIGVGARAEAAYPHRALVEGDTIRVGSVMLKVIETPGHTPESLSILICAPDGGEVPWGVLTGDTLFVGDVGRVDILSSRLPVVELAGLMYDSLHLKLLTLPDETRVYPAHGAGSLCGRNMGKETWSTIGRERAMNAALRPMSREDFIAEVTCDVPETPRYYLHSRDLNKAGPALVAERPMPPALTAAECAARVRDGALLLDTRPAAAFGVSHPAGALNVSLDGQFASWVGTLVRPDQPLVLIVESGRAEEAVLRLARVGYESVVGVIDGDLSGWDPEGLPLVTLDRLPAQSWLDSGRNVLDVRRSREWNDFHLSGARHIPLAQLPERLGELDRTADWVVVCAGGYRSSIAASLLQRAGFRRVINGEGGMDAWRKAGFPVEAGVLATPQ